MRLKPLPPQAQRPALPHCQMGRGGGTIVVITETPGDITTITTDGSTPGTTTLPTESGSRTTVIVVTPSTGMASDTTQPAGSGDEKAGIATDTTQPASSGDEATATLTDSTGGVTTVTTSEADTTSATITGGSTTSSVPFPPPSTELPPASSTMSSEIPSQTCADLENGNFSNGDGTLPPWYISNQVTADSSGVIAATPDNSGTRTAFALIPSEGQFSQVYLNQQLPSCGNPPPEVTLTVRFQYQFTGASEGCSIGASVNRSPDNILDITDDSSSGVWQSYVGPPLQVQLTSDSLFTLKLSCNTDSANTPAILITDISVY